MEDKVFIFISHSHRDLEKVRKIRNFLERNSSEPLLFFLKSKDDDDEITSLIEEEIDARIWFIYCDSKNARESVWVNKELDYVYKTGKRNTTTIDLDCDFDKKGYLKESTKRRLRKELMKFIYLQHIYVSYSHQDSVVVDKIRKVLRKYEIVTSSDESLAPSMDWGVDLVHKIKRSSAILFFLSENSFNSYSYKTELQYAFANNKDVFVVYLKNGNSTLLNEIPVNMKQYTYTLDITTPTSIEKGAVGLVYYLFDHISQE